jgi:hypothetical protein
MSLLGTCLETVYMSTIKYPTGNEFLARSEEKMNEPRLEQDSRLQAAEFRTSATACLAGR